MAIHEDMRTTLKESLKAKDETRLRTTRSILTAFTNELVATGRTPQDMLDDTQAISVIKRLAKQRKESIVQFEAAGRDDLASPEKAELVILENYLPTLMSTAELEPLVREKLSALGINDKSKMGMAIGMLMKELQGKADGADVKAIVETILTA